MGNLNGAWYGNTERSLVNSSPVGRADLYESVPNYASKYLGYFQFYTNGVMTYTSGTLTIPQTTVSNIVRSVNTSTLTYGPTVLGAAYTLVSTNNLTGNPLSTWPAILSSAQPGTGSGETSKATATDAARFYNVLAQ